MFYGAAVVGFEHYFHGRRAQSYMYDGLGGLLSNSRKPRVMNKYQKDLGDTLRL